MTPFLWLLSILDVAANRKVTQRNQLESIPTKLQFTFFSSLWKMLNAYLKLSCLQSKNVFKMYCIEIIEHFGDNSTYPYAFTYARHCRTFFHRTAHVVLTKPDEVGTATTPTLQMRTLRHRHIKELIQDHTGRKCRARRSAPKSMLSNSCTILPLNSSSNTKPKTSK